MNSCIIMDILGCLLNFESSISFRQLLGLNSNLLLLYTVLVRMNYRIYYNIKITRRGYKPELSKVFTNISSPSYGFFFLKNL
jgi:hypothetical protein